LKIIHAGDSTAEVQAHTMTAEEIHQSPLVQDERYELVDGRRRHCAQCPAIKPS
jgi:hypothetical protein